MRLSILGVALAAAVCTLAVDVAAQSNNNDFTPLNSRIRRERQFPTSLNNPWGGQTSEVSRKRSREMLSQFSKCVYNRSREGSLSLLERTDYGFTDFAQIDLENDRAVRTYGFRDCLSRVAQTHGTGVQLRFSAGGLRQWLVQEAYFDRYDESPSWIQPGMVVAEREFPLSGPGTGASAAMDLSDCVVAADPYTADFYSRTAGGSDEEKAALDALTPSLGGCLPQGQQVQLSPALLRIWIGESLWHAANHSGPALAQAPQEAE